MQRGVLRLGLRARSVLKPTPLSLLLFGVVVLLFGTLTTRRQLTYSLFGDQHNEELRIGPGPALRFVTDESATGHRTSRTEISWPSLLACVLFCYLGSRGIARLVERRRKGRPLLVLASVIAATLVLAAVAAAGVSLYYWGYAFARPEPGDMVEDFAVVTGLSSVACDLEPEPRCTLSAAEPVREIVSHCKKDPYYCLEERVVFALTRAGLPPADNHPAPAGLAGSLARFLAGTDLLAEHEPGYDDHTLKGLVVTGLSVSGEPLAAFALSGRQVSNDHYPHYEILLGLGEDGYRPRSQRRFFYDVAGMEGMEWLAMFLGLGVLGLLVSVTATVVVLAWTRAPGSRQES